MKVIELLNVYLDVLTTHRICIKDTSWDILYKGQYGKCPLEFLNAEVQYFSTEKINDDDPKIWIKIKKP